MDVKLLYLLGIILISSAFFILWLVSMAMCSDTMISWIAGVKTGALLYHEVR